MAWTDLKAYVNTSSSDEDFVAQCWDEAKALVDAFIGDAEVPVAATERAYLEVGSELFHRRQAPNGVAQFTTIDGSAIRVARDPMVGAYPILQRYTGLGFA